MMKNLAFSKWQHCRGKPGGVKHGPILYTLHGVLDGTPVLLGWVVMMGPI